MIKEQLELASQGELLNNLTKPIDREKVSSSNKSD